MLPCVLNSCTFRTSQHKKLALAVCISYLLALTLCGQTYRTLKAFRRVAAGSS